MIKCRTMTEFHPSDTVAHLARLCLNQNILPLVLQAARLPAHTTLDELRALNLPPPRDDSYVASRAADFFTDLALPGISGALARVAGTAEDLALHACITGLIWRDAYECSRSRELAFSTNIAGIDNSEFESDADTAAANWQAWEKLDPIVQESFQSCFLENVSYEEFFRPR